MRLLWAPYPNYYHSLPNSTESSKENIKEIFLGGNEDRKKKKCGRWGMEYLRGT